jgi:exosome complex component RRP46
MQYLPVLPWLLNATCLAILDAAIPLRCTFTSTIIALMSKTILRENPTVKNLKLAKSVHVLTFTSKYEILLAESEGRFSLDEFAVIEERARSICIGDPEAMEQDDDADRETSLQDRLRSAVEEKSRRDERWKDR